MTKEEAKKILEEYSLKITNCGPESFAIATLLEYVGKLEKEQEPILDKIRAEIEPKCDRINSLASVLPYTAHREIQELLCEIMDLCKAEIESQESENKDNERMSDL